MIIPMWAVFGCAVALLSAAMMLIQERFRINGFALAFWNKVACAVFMLPPVLYFGVPQNPYFYALVTGQALLWVVSDVIFFSAIPKVGAGVVSRLLPASTILTFCLWFLFDPALFDTYLQTPWRSVLIVAVLCASVYFAMRLKHCPVSWTAFRMIWFVLFAAVIGPIGFKLVAGQANLEQGAFSFVFCEALVMIVCWLIWFWLRRPVSGATLFSVQAAKAGFMIGSVSCLMAASNFAAIYLVDNPALIHAVRITDAAMIVLFYKLTGRKEKADVAAGLGVVACAVAIVALKSL